MVVERNPSTSGIRPVIYNIEDEFKCAELPEIPTGSGFTKKEQVKLDMAGDNVLMLLGGHVTKKVFGNPITVPSKV